MSRVFAGLKWRLLLNGWFRTRLGVLAFIGALLGFAIAVLVALGVAHAARHPDSLLALRAAGLGTYVVVFTLWTFGPLLVGIDETVDPSRLVLVPLTRRDLRVGLVTASLIGFGSIASAIVLGGLAYGFARGGAARVVLVLVAVAVGFALALTASRALSTALTRVQRSRRGRDISVLIGAFTGAALWLGVQLAPHLGDAAERRLLGVLRITPPGLVGQAVVDASRGRLLAAALGIAGGAAFAALFGWAWISGATKLLVDTGASVSGRVSTTAVAEAGPWLRGGTTRASIRKELLYLVRSPARRSATLVAIALGTGFVLLQVLQRGGPPAAGAVLAAPLAGFFAVSAVNNQLGHDGASLWIEIVAGGPRAAGFVGREVSWIPAIVLPCVPAAVILAALSGGWRYLPFAVALSFAVAGIPLGVGACIAVFAPIAIADDANPFTNRNANTGQGCLVGLMAVVALLGDGLLLAPVIAAVAVTHEHLASLTIVVVATACYAALVWAAGVALAARRVRGREPELFAALSPRV